MANIESEFPGYDEYQYDVDTIGHDPNELISYLTAKFNAFTPAQVQTELQALFDQQYILTTREEVQIRYRTVTWTDEDGDEHEEEEAYEYYILHVTLRNRSLGTILSERLTEDEKQRYAALLQLKGNKPYLFGDDIYANPSEGEHYQVPGEVLSDPSFAALITEAENTWGIRMSGAVPPRQPLLIAAVLSAMFTPIPVFTTCPGLRPPAFTTSARLYHVRKQSPAT